MFFVMNFALGLVGFLCVEAYKDSITEYMAENSKSILTADLSVSVRRNFTEKEKSDLIKALPVDAQISESYDFFSMLQFEDQNRLVLIKAIDERYPFYGEIELETGKRISGADPKAIIGQKKAWAYLELQEQLGMVLDSQIKLGKLTLQIDDFVVKDASQTFRAGNFAPRIFIDKSLLPDSGLIQFGSTFTHSFLIKLPDDKKAEQLRKDLFAAFPDPSINIESAETASEDSARQLKLFSDYLSLVSIVALFLASIGASYLFRLFLSQKLKEMAVLRCLGITANQTIRISILQTFILGMISIVPALLLAKAFIPLLARLLNNLTPFALAPVISWKSILISFALASVGSVLICLPFALRIRDLKPNFLFSEFRLPSTVDFTNWTYLLPSFLFFWGLAIFQSRSLNVGTVFVLTVLGVVILLTILGFVLMKAFDRSRGSWPWFVRYSLKGASRRKASTLSVVITLGMASMLMNILPQLKESIQTEFAADQSQLPSLFMFDIQDEQKDELLEFLKEYQIFDVKLYPLVRSRIIKINEVPYERVIEKPTLLTREEEQSARSRNRGVNLSYRNKLSSSEQIIEGKPLSGTYNERSNMPVELSLEVKYAERMGIKLGDKIQFDIQGISIIGVVTNLRKVKWASFQPNFFILMQPGAISDAPKTYIGAVPPMSKATKGYLQKEIVQKFANISVIDLARTTQDIIRLADKFRWSLELMSLLGVLSGMMVLYSVVRTQVWLRRREINLLKVLGAKSQVLTGYIVIEFLSLSLGAVLIGVLTSTAVAYSLIKYLFVLEFHFNFLWPLISTLVILLSGLAVILMATRKVMKERAMTILRGDI